MNAELAKLPIGGPAWLRAWAADKEEMSHALGHIDDECEREEKREIQGLRDAADRMERLEVALTESKGAMKDLLDGIYEAMEGNDLVNAYSYRHGIESAAVLTVYDDHTARAIAERLAPRIAGKTVVEIGGGIGLLALHLGTVASRVWCIEANPMWSWAFAGTLLKSKPRNVSFLFGSADEFAGQFQGDVAVYCTHSDVKGMGEIARRFAPSVIDVYGEMIAENPEAYDPQARRLRAVW